MRAIDFLDAPDQEPSPDFATLKPYHAKSNALTVGVKSAAQAKAELDDFEPFALFTTNEITTTSGETLFSVKVMKVEPDGLTLKYKPAGGGICIQKIPFDNLPESLQQQFGYTPQKSAAFKI